MGHHTTNVKNSPTLNTRLYSLESGFSSTTSLNTCQTLWSSIYPHFTDKETTTQKD